MACVCEHLFGFKGLATLYVKVGPVLLYKLNHHKDHECKV